MIFEIATLMITVMTPVYYGMYRLIRIGMIVEGCPYCTEKRIKTDAGVKHVGEN